jgi:hypothetical protein
MIHARCGGGVAREEVLRRVSTDSPTTCLVNALTGNLNPLYLRCDLHSSRKATSGSTWVALRAGR